MRLKKLGQKWEKMGEKWDEIPIFYSHVFPIFLDV